MNYPTKARLGEGLGSLAVNATNAYLQGRQVANQTRQVDYQNPDRPIGSKDLLGLAIAASKEAEQSNTLATATGHPELVKPFDFAGFVNSAKQALGQVGGSAPMTQMAATPSSLSQVAAPTKSGQDMSSLQNPIAGVVAQGQQGIAQANQAGTPVPIDMNRVNSLIEELYQARKAKGGSNA